jgi:hypothetical protein
MMMMKKILLFFAALFAASAQGQTITVLATGLTGPIGICKTDSGALYVAEQGSGHGDGKIDVIYGGILDTLITGLPSATDTATGETTGPYRAMFHNGMLMVVIGKGPDINAGSILSFDISAWSSGMPPLTLADAVESIHVSSWALSNGFDDSNPFSMAWDSTGNMYIADAGANAILKYDMFNNFSVLDSFPNIANVWTAFPPFIDYVPTRIINNGSGGFYVCNLTGFPFIGSISQVVSIDTAGSQSVIATGISQAVDMEMDSATGDLYILRFGVFDSSGMPVPSTALISRLHNGIMDTVLSNFGPCAGMTMTMDSAMSFYVTDLFSGSVLRITNTTSINRHLLNLTDAIVSPNPLHQNFQLQYSLAAPADVTCYINDVTGQEVYRSLIAGQQQGEHIFYFDGATVSSALKPGFYMLTMRTSAADQRTLKLIVY